MRPDSMKYFDDFRNQNVLAVEQAKKNGKKVVGTYCGYAPYELILAAGAVPVGLCGTSQNPIPAAEKILPRNLCPLIKSSFGFAITDTCPFFRHSDIVIAETTCDGKKKMFELLKEYRPMHVIHLPPGADRAGAHRSWLEEMKLFKTILEDTCSVTITSESLWETIRMMNKQRIAARSLHELNRFDPAPLTGIDMLKALLLLFFNADYEYGLNIAYQLIDEVKEMALKGISPFPGETPRVLLTGCPVSIGSEKVVTIIEESGASIVAFEMCTGYRGFSLVEEGNGSDPLEAMAERYLNIPCPCMSPNPGRPGLIGDLIKEYAVDGIIDITWQACHTFAIEDAVLQHHNQEHWGNLPFLHIETDYSTADIEQLTTRISAFIEIMRERRAYVENKQ